MRQDWIEFKKDEINSMSLRPEYIVGISEFPFNPEENLNEHTRILYDVGNSVQDIAIDEPYEQVKQKIMDAEKVDLNDVVVEHFTREEYAMLNEAVLEKLNFLNKTEPYSSKDNAYDRLQNKINEILKEK